MLPTGVFLELYHMKIRNSDISQKWSEHVDSEGIFHRFRAPFSELQKVDIFRFLFSVLWSQNVSDCYNIIVLYSFGTVLSKSEDFSSFFVKNDFPDKNRIFIRKKRSIRWSGQEPKWKKTIHNMWMLPNRSISPDLYNVPPPLSSIKANITLREFPQERHPIHQHIPTVTRWIATLLSDPMLNPNPSWITL